MIKPTTLALALAITHVPAAEMPAAPVAPAADASDAPAPADDEKLLLYPTGLTVVVTDKACKVLDTVKVPDDKKFYEITFTLEEGRDELRVFALGTRIDKDIPKDLLVKGLPKKEGGRGKVVVSIDEGSLTGISGNGFVIWKLTDEVKKEIAADLKEDKPADLTTMDELVEEE